MAKRMTKKEIKKVVAEAIFRADAPNPEGPAEVKRRTGLTIEELERLLNSEEDRNIHINPNGEIVDLGQKQPRDKVLTIRENLGGEYGL